MFGMNAQWWHTDVVSAQRSGTKRHVSQRLGYQLGQLLLLAMAAVAALGSLPSRTSAQTVYWKSGVQAGWSQTADWSSGVIPTSTNSTLVVLQSGGTVTVTGNRSAPSLVLGGTAGSTTWGNGTLDVYDTGVVTVTNGLQFGPGPNRSQQSRAARWTLPPPPGELTLGGPITMGVDCGTATINLTGGYSTWAATSSRRAPAAVS